MEEPLLDFNKVCRVCLQEGQMMSVFKVKIFKKIMACSSVQVWLNDGLPDQICYKCSANLHISFQFKQLCEKSDGKLRQQLIRSKATAIENKTECVFLECNPAIEMYQEEKFDPFTQLPQQSDVDYSVQPKMEVLSNGDVGEEQDFDDVEGYSMHSLEQLQQPIVQQQAELSVIPQLEEQNVAMDQEVVEDESESVDLKKDEECQEKVKKCTVCGKEFMTSRQMGRHMKTHIIDKPYKCQMCSKAFSHSGNFKIHLRTHTDERPYECTICGKSYRQTQGLENHVKTHTGERPHQCNMCEMAFRTRSNLVAHMRTHTGERPYVCSVCQKAFCQSNELTKHMRSHTGEKTHECDICHKAFNGSSTLTVHRRIHTGEKPYFCKICNKSFIQAGSLSSHMRVHGDNSRTSDEHFSCTFCNKTFLLLRNLQKHIKSAHPSIGSYPCSSCDAKFSNQEEYDMHGCFENLMQ